MDAGFFRDEGMNEAIDDRQSGAMRGGIQRLLCLSRQEMQEGSPTPTPRSFEEPDRSSWGQEEASKLHRKTRRLLLQHDLIADLFHKRFFKFVKIKLCIDEKMWEVPSLIIYELQ